MVDAHKNFAISTLQTSPGISGLSATVATGTGTLFPTAPFNATVWPGGSTPLSSNAEIVRVTDISGDNLTISRTQEDTIAQEIESGYQIAATITAKTFTDIESSLSSAGVSVYNITNYGALGDAYLPNTDQTVNPSATDNTTAITNAVAAIVASPTGRGVVYTPPGAYMTNMITFPQGVSFIGSDSGTSGWVLKSGSTTPTMLITAGFSANAGQQFGSYAGPHYFYIRDMFFDGNNGNITTVSGAGDYRGQNSLIKIYGWHWRMLNLDLRNAKENGIYTEYVDVWSNSFNDYQFAESVMENVFVKNAGGAGYCNRGPHDSILRNCYFSGYNDSGATGVVPYVGYIQQSNHTTGGYYSADGCVMQGVHCWGQFVTNAIYIDTSNVINGWCYAEGATTSALKLVSSVGNNFKVIVAYSVAGVELSGTSNNNYIEAQVESNVTGGLFQLDTVASGNTLIHTGGYNRSAGAIFDLTTGGTYSGSRNTFITNRAYTGTIFSGTPNQLDVVSRGYGEVIYADDFGAAGDDTTDDATVLNAAIAATPEGGIIQLGYKKYRTNSPLFLTRNKRIRGTQGLRWRYAITPNTYIKPKSTFTGLAAIIMQDKEQGGYATEQGGQRIEDLNIDMSALTTGTADGILGSGLVRDVRITNTSVSFARGKGLHTVSYTRLDSSVNYPRGWQLSHVVADTGFDIGFAFNNLDDSIITDCLAVGNAGNGFFLAGLGEDHITNCRAVFNKNYGFYVTGATFGNTLFTGISTDRNEYSGVKIDATGNFPISFNGISLRRDGRNGNSGGGSYSGIEVDAATAPVIIDNLQVVPGVDDNGTGTNSPQYGLSATSSDVTVNSGQIWAATTPLNSTTNTNFIISPYIQLATGVVGSKVTTFAGGVQTAGYNLVANGGGTSPSWQRIASWIPGDHGMITWSADPGLINQVAILPTAGQVNLIKVHVPVATTITNIILSISTAGATLTSGQNFAALYSGAGALLSATADQSTSWATAAMKVIPLSTPQSVAVGDYYIAFYANGTTLPTFRSGGSAGSIANANLSLAASRFGTADTGRTTSMPSTLAAIAATSVSWWGGLS